MVVQHNLTAMNSNRMLGITTSTQAKSTEKLSSGYKINRAADDAAGLSISEKMRKQIRGLSQASLNAQDGISSVQTAEGALNEVQDMLQRMNELAVKASNGTMSENDRSYIQDEIKQLETEIDRVAETTKFNETYLLKGDKNATPATDYQYQTNAATFTDMDGADIADGKFYLKGETTALTADEAKEALAAGKTLYKDAFVENPTAATVGTKDSGDDIEYAAATKGVYTTGAVSQTGTNGNKAATITVAYTDAAGNTKTKDVNFQSGADAGATATAIKNAIALDADLKDLFDVDLDGANKIKFTSKTEGTTAAKVTGLTVKTAGDDTVAVATGTATTATDEHFKVKANTKIYNANGKELTEEEIKKAAIAGTDIYTQSSRQTAAVKDKDYKYEEVALYDKDGNKVSANGLQSYFDEEGEYIGGLYKEKTAETEISEAEIPDYIDDTQTKTGALTLKLHVGADATDNNQITIDIDAMSAAGLGVKDIKVDGADDTNARDAIETIKAAIQQISKQRSALGAVQNRLEHTINNLDNVVENTTSAESQIRDTDMATEMVKYSNNNILAQAGQSMLAQANQSNQGVLSLLG